MIYVSGTPLLKSYKFFTPVPPVASSSFLFVSFLHTRLGVNTSKHPSLCPTLNDSKLLFVNDQNSSLPESKSNRLEGREVKKIRKRRREGRVRKDI